MLKHISLFCVIAIMIAIFLLSAQPAKESSDLSGKIVTVVLKIIIPNYDELPLMEQESIKEKVSFFVRKLAHFTEFAALGFFLIMYLLTFQPYIKTFNLKLLIRVFLGWIIGTFYAVTDEIHQMFVTDRYSSIYDVVIDSSGVLFGIILLIFLFSFVFRNSQISIKYKQNIKS